MSSKEKFLHRESIYQTSSHSCPRGQDAAAAVAPAQLSVNSGVSVCYLFVCRSWRAARVLDGVRDVENELHVHGSLGNAGATSVDDGDQRAVQFVHVALGQQPASGAGLVLHLSKEAEGGSRCWLTKTIKNHRLVLPCQPALRCEERASWCQQRWEQRDEASGRYRQPEQFPSGNRCRTTAPTRGCGLESWAGKTPAWTSTRSPDCEPETLHCEHRVH